MTTLFAGRGTAAPGRLRRMGCAGAVLAVAVPAWTLPPSAAGQPPEAIASPPVGIVVLVDESGSLTEADIAAERAAAAMIAQSEFAQGSQVAVVGFAGRNGGPNQEAVRVTCTPTRVSAGPARDYLARCVDDLRRRTRQEGDATDFVSALTQGLSLLDGMTGVSAKLVFLLTDGVLDVDDDPAYGGDQGARQAAARHRLSQLLAGAADGGTQLWPLGFGRADKKELDSFAGGGSQRTCGLDSPKPQARVAESTAAVVTSLAEAYASARCARSAPPAVASLSPGGTVELPVDVPAIATDGSIAVHKANAAITVGFHDPSGQPVPESGERGDSRFEVSGESSQVEVLRIRNPQPGRWHVKLTAPPGVAAETVTAIVIWQGAVRSSVTVNPPVPRPGEAVAVELQLHTRRGPLTDPAALGGITAVAQVSGDGFSPVDVPLEPGAHGGFGAEFTIPAGATGRFQVIGKVSGPGIANDERPWTGRITRGSGGLRGQITFNDQRIEPGATAGGEVLLANESGSARRVRLVLTELAANTAVTVSPSTAEVSGSGNVSIPFRLAVDPGSRLGFAQATLRVVDEADQDLVYAERLLVFQVGYPPPPPSVWERLRWLWIGLAVLLVSVAAGAVLRRRRRRGEHDVRGLQARLYRDGRQFAYLPAPDEPSVRFAFLVRDPHGDQPRLDHAAGAADAYLARRGEDGTVVVRLPDGAEVVLRTGERTGLPGGIELAVVGARAAGHSRDEAVAVGGPAQPEDDLL